MHHVVDYLKAQGAPQYVEGLLDGAVDDDGNGDDAAGAATVTTNPTRCTTRRSPSCCRTRRSISLVQRQLRIGYNRSARLIERWSATAS